MSGAGGPLSVQLDDRWIELPVRATGEPDAWAEQVVDDALRVRGQVETAAVRHLYVQTYAAVVEQLRARADQPGSQVGAAWALVADADLLPLTVVEAALHLLDEGQHLDGFVEQVVAPPSERFAPPDVTELATASGTAVRVQQLRIVQEQGPEPTVQTSVVHVWPGPEDGTALTLTAWFDSPFEAELSRAALDELAASLRQDRA